MAISLKATSHIGMPMADVYLLIDSIIHSHVTKATTINLVAFPRKEVRDDIADAMDAVIDLTTFVERGDRNQEAPEKDRERISREYNEAFVSLQRAQATVSEGARWALNDLFVLRDDRYERLPLSVSVPLTALSDLAIGGVPDKSLCYSWLAQNGYAGDEV